MQPWDGGYAIKWVIQVYEILLHALIPSRRSAQHNEFYICYVANDHLS